MMFFCKVVTDGITLTLRELASAFTHSEVYA